MQKRSLFPCVLQLGGAMAPALKELPRWLDANMEYAVAADWSDIVKLSVSKNIWENLCHYRYSSIYDHNWDRNFPPLSSAVIK